VVHPALAHRHGQAVGVQQGLEHRQHLVAGQRLGGVDGQRAGHRLVDDVGQLEDVAEHRVDHLGDRCLLEIQAHRIAGADAVGQRPRRLEQGIVAAHHQGFLGRRGFGLGRRLGDRHPVGGAPGNGQFDRLALGAGTAHAAGQQQGERRSDADPKGAGENRRLHNPDPYSDELKRAARSRAARSAAWRSAAPPV
jgi:hypothetical protein